MNPKLLFLLCMIYANGQSTNSDLLIGKSNPAWASQGMHPTAMEAFKKMQDAAKTAGIDLELVSGYRSYDRQRSIWNRKYKQFTAEGMTGPDAIQKIITYSTLPGTSRHHWGTDIDITDGNIPKEGDILVAEKFHNGGPYEPLRIWMETHAENFGFFLVYTNDLNRKGFAYEPWHYSYAPLSITFLKEYIRLSLIDKLSDHKLEGAMHMDAAFLSRYKNQQLLDINPLLIDLQ